MISDLRFALRNLRAAPAYALAAILTLALAIAATTAIFGAVYGILLKPLPIRDPGQLVVAWETNRAKAQPVVELAYVQIHAMAAEARGLEAVAGMGSSLWPAVLDGTEHPARLASAAVTGSFFETLGARAVLGRTFVPSDDDGSSGRAVVLSHRLWTERFGSDVAIVGRTLRLDRHAYTVVGVMPPDFDFPRGAELWTPVVPILRQLSETLKFDVLTNVRVLYAVGRLRPGVAVEAARDELTAIAARHGSTRNKPERAIVTPLLQYTLGPIRQGLWWLLGAVGVLLLVACANVSGLTLTRASVRRRDQAVRLALGATRAQLARVWIAETAWLGIGGAVLGIVGARWLLAAVVALAPDNVPRIGELAIDGPAVMFTVAVTLAAILLSAGAAVIHASAARLGTVINETAHATSAPASTRARSTLVIAQVALAVVLLVVAGLVVRSFTALQRLDVGFDPTNVLTMTVEPSSDERPARQWFTTLLSRIDALPGVESAGAVFLRPLAYGEIGTDTTMLYEGEGRTEREAAEQQARNPRLNFQMATPGYFRTMRIPLVKGRLFDERDREGTPRVVLINERAAARLWPGQDPIGKRLGTPQSTGTAASIAWHTVIGVVKDVHYRGLDDVRLDIYEPAAQSSMRPEFLVVRTAGDPLAVAAAVQAEVRAVDRGAVMSGITAMEAVLARELAPWRLSSWLLLLFATMAFVLAIVGLVGLLGLEVTQRMREFALRIALGANARDVRALVFRSAATRGLAGLAIGIAAALAISQALRALLFGVTPADPPTYALVAIVVAVAVVTISLVPAIRAGSIDPIAVLKRD